MRTKVADAAALVCWFATGIGFVWAGFFFMASYTPHLAPDAQLFYLMGVALGLAGSAVCCWLLVGLMCALIAGWLEAAGKEKAARRINRFLPRFLQRLAGSTVALCLAVSPSFAIDLSFEDTAGDNPAVSKLADTNPVDTDVQDHVDDSPALPDIPSEDPSITPLPIPLDKPVAPKPQDPQEPTDTERSRTPDPEISGPIDLRLQPSKPDPSETEPSVQPSPKQKLRSSRPKESGTSESSRKTTPPISSPLPGQERRQARTATVVVLRGDSLWSIAQAELGPSATDAQIQLRTQDWYRQNESAIGADPNLIHPGTILTAPTAKDH